MVGVRTTERLLKLRSHISNYSTQLFCLDIYIYSFMTTRVAIPMRARDIYFLWRRAQAVFLKYRIGVQAPKSMLVSYLLTTLIVTLVVLLFFFLFCFSTSLWSILLFSFYAFIGKYFRYIFFFLSLSIWILWTLVLTSLLVCFCPWTLIYV